MQPHLADMPPPKSLGAASSSGGTTAWLARDEPPALSPATEPPGAASSSGATSAVTTRAAWDRRYAIYAEVFGTQAPTVHPLLLFRISVLHRGAVRDDVPITTVTPNWFGAELFICGESGFQYMTSAGVQRIIVCASEVSFPTALLPPGAQVRTCIMNHEFNMSYHGDPEEAPSIRHFRETLEWFKGKNTCAVCLVGRHRSAAWIVGALMAAGWPLDMAANHIESVRPRADVSSWSRSSKSGKQRAPSRERWQRFEGIMHRMHPGLRPVFPYVVDAGLFRTI